MHVHMKPGSVAGTTSHTAFGSHGSGSHGSGSVKLGRNKSHDKTKQLPQNVSVHSLSMQNNKIKKTPNKVLTYQYEQASEMSQ